MGHTTLVDANALGHADNYATKLSVGGIETQAVFGGMNRMRQMLVNKPETNLTILWDGVAKFRYEIFPEYKANRVAKTPEEEKLKSSYQAQVPLLRAVYEALGLTQIIPALLEADDLAGYFARQIPALGGEVTLVTGDSDWWQFVTPKVEWYDPRNDGRLVNHANFYEQTGYFTPEEYIEGKALIGDSTDGIPPSGGIGKDTAPKFMAQFRSVQNYWDKCDSGAFVPTSKAMVRLWKGVSEWNKDQWAAQYTGDPDDKKALKKHMDEWIGDTRNNFIRNKKLMVLNATKEQIQAGQLTVVKKPLNEAAFRTLSERLCFMSVLRNYEEYIAPFRAYTKRVAP